MKACVSPARAFFAALCFGPFVAFGSVAQGDGDAKTPASATKQNDAPASGSKPGRKAQAFGDEAKSGSIEQKLPKRARYSTEGEARAHCRGEVVWIDQHNFNHYKGSREWGQKPGAFGCEN